ncbi:SURF1 family cytochrome oxidase biogenesis protein [Amnibacterium kyonggiense]|uniref:SURF1-like protein n=1 Tax=Amnibacterium kyonggiense TaxID=595671 RepID=A0A4R7FR62_9MICO|nr:SURF1 family cytochrome oxidase biogenesis protein [Amnibacterium kyonggiense]TDS80188.1 cytochrome oxidase assembly protein ShyY1 [Amnibacterium kyonggiense]
MSSSAAPARTLRAAFLTPRSIGLLLLAILIAVVFALLSQWQVSRAVQQGTVVARATEKIVPLSSIARPAEQQTDASVGQRASTRGVLVPRDTVIASDRLNHGTRGWWVVGHAIVDEPRGAQLAVALGWAPSEAIARAAADEIRRSAPVDGPLVGRYVDSDAAQPSTSGDPDALDAVSTARLVNLWTQDVGQPTYEGVLTLDRAPDGLTDIYSPKPGEQVELNLLNILYAIEWVLLAVAAFYVWYRLVRDRWEQETAPVDAVEPVHHDV